jgi:preprotein translocase subunit SecB
MANAATFRFLGYRVPETILEIGDSAFTAHPNKFDISIDVQQNFHRENTRFVEVVLRIRVRSEDEGLKLSLTIKGGFQAEREMSNELFEDLASTNAPAILLPYARAIITNTTVQAGIPPVILPLVNLRAKAEGGTAKAPPSQ